MLAVRAVCYLLALACFVLAAASIAAGRVNLVALGLAFYVLPGFLAAVE